MRFPTQLKSLLGTHTSTDTPFVLEKEGQYAYSPLLSSTLSETSEASHSPIASDFHRRAFRRPCLLAVLITALLLCAGFGITSIVAYELGMLRLVPHFDKEAINQAGLTRKPLTLEPSIQRPVWSTTDNNLVLHDFEKATKEATSASDLELLILCPMKNAAKDLPRFFELLDRLEHPKQKTSLGFLVGDEEDDTAIILSEWVKERQAGEEENRFRKATVLRKDFKMELPGGASRHAYWLQSARRAIMAKARTYLLTATLEPTIDWVLWLDSDIADYSTTLFTDLLLLGNAGLQASKQTREALSLPISKPEEWNDVIIPNAMQRLSDGGLHGFDMNNWAETPESLKLKADLDDETVLIEGNIFQHMQRLHLADTYEPYTEAPELFSVAQNGVQLPTDSRYDATSPAWIGKSMEMNGVGGVAALVRADIHRLGAVFPAWIFDHQLETEGFGQLAKTLGARIVGLSNYFVLHHV